MTDVSDRLKNAFVVITRFLFSKSILLSASLASRFPKLSLKIVVDVFTPQLFEVANFLDFLGLLLVSLLLYFLVFIVKRGSAAFSLFTKL